MQEVVIFVCLVTLLVLYVKYKNGITQELFLAAIMSSIWVNFSGLYTYRDASFTIGSFNLFPFIAWVTGLVILREIYERCKCKDKFIKVSILYVIILVVLEYIGYNWWGIQLASHYPGLLGLELMHMPFYGQAYYLLAGPAYLMLTDYFKVK